MAWTRIRGAMVAAAVAATLVSLVPAAGAAVNDGDPPVCNGLTATIWGDDGNNRLYGTPGRDVIHGLGGRDRIFGLGGRDVLCGGDGADLLKGQKGADTLIGGNGRDRLIGGQGSDTLIGNRGDDLLLGGYGNDELTSGPGFDDVFGGFGIDECIFDKRDVYGECERGVVYGAVAVGSATYGVDVPDEFIVQTFVGQGGVTIPIYIVNIYAERAEPGDMFVQLLGDAGEVLFEAEQFGTVYQEQALVWGNPSEFTIGGVDYHDVTFEQEQLLSTFGDFEVDGFSSEVFKIDPPLSSDEVVALDVLPPEFDFTDVAVITLGEGRGPSVELFAADVFLFGEFVFTPADGGQIVGIRAPGSDWFFTRDV